jgi:uncharacterized membrane protein
MESKKLTEQQKADIEKNNDMAAFSYFLVLAPVLLFTRKDSPFIQFHARQATVLLLVAVILVVIGGKIAYGNFLVLAVAITGIIQANMGVMWRTPVVSEMLDAGYTPEAVWRGIKYALAGLVRTLRSIFGPPDGAKQDPFRKNAIPGKDYCAFPRQAVQQVSQSSTSNTGFAAAQSPQQLFIQNAFLRGFAMRDIKNSSENKIKTLQEEITTNWLKGSTVQKDDYSMFAESDEKSVLIGGYSDTSCLVLAIVGDEKKLIHVDLSNQKAAEGELAQLESFLK